MQKKSPLPTSFSPVTSTIVEISSQNLLFSFDPFAKLVRNFKAITSASSKLWNLNSKKLIFLSNAYKMEVMTNSLIEMLVTKLWSNDHIYHIIWVT